MAVNIVAHLLSLVSEDRVGLSGNGNLYEIGKETVQFDAAMAGACEASPRKTPTFNRNSAPYS